ncbi:GGDEF domain-containing protein [Thiolapillus sp.]
MADFGGELSGYTCTLSVSIGVAECLSGQRMSKSELFKQADMSLYAAKAAGRACIGPRVAKTKTGQ